MGISSLKTSQYQPWILHIQISIGTKFYLKQTILEFWDQMYPPKKHFQSKTKEVNINVEFSIFKLV